MRETEITVAVLEGINDTLDKFKSQGFDLTEKILMTDYYYSKYPDEVLGNFSYEEMIRNSFVLRKVESAVCESQLIYKDKELDEKHRQTFEKYDDCAEEYINLVSMHAFCDGFRLAAKLMAEALL